MGLRETIISSEKMDDLRRLTTEALSIEGDMAECGVYYGGSAVLIDSIMSGSGKKLLLFDSFKGLPDEIDPIDFHKPGEFLSPQADVMGIFKDSPHVEFYVGFFRDTFKDVVPRKFAMVHVDADLYHSVKQCCEFFYPLMSSGGIMVFDDYFVPTCLGAKKAVDEYFANIPGISIPHQPTKAGVVRKP